MLSFSSDRIVRRIFLVLLILGGSLQVFSQTAANFILRGEVFDSNELPIAKAAIKIVSDAGKEFSCLTDSQGAFDCAIDFNGSFTLVVQAEGFSILRQNFASPQDFFDAAKFVLIPAVIETNVVVTANRVETRIGDTAASVVTLNNRELKRTAAPTIDDALRQVAGFSLFRRTGSRYANPTAQGVSLRGVGASGASRSLVLFDGVPLNDPFGGWIQWNRIAPIAVERVEVLRGGASSLYGSDALSGAINILPRTAKKKFTLTAEIYGGTQNTFSGSTYFGAARNNFAADFSAQIFQTEGYILTDKAERGAIDDFTGSKNSNLSARFAKNFGDKADIFFRGSNFGEARTNGTPAQINRTHIRQFILGGAAEVQSLNINWRIYGGTQTYDQTFSAVSANRNSENLTRIQRVPAQNIGFSAQISGVFFKNQTFVAGFEAAQVRGASDEIGVVNNRLTLVSGAGGREKTFGVFVQDFARINKKLIIAGSLRYDGWKNFRALDSSRTLANNRTTTLVFPDRTEDAVSPQISAVYQIFGNFSVFAVASGSFRAPTLNELYRGFRVGSVVTNANANLRAETAANYEAGANFSFRKFAVRGNFFSTTIKNPISNVTLSVTPSLIVRQRRNVGRTRTTGAEIEAEFTYRSFGFSAGYLLTDSRIVEFPANRRLENLFVPQTARHQFTFQTNYTKNKWTFAAQARAASKQFDDDLNTLRLEPYFQLDLFAARQFKENLQIFAAIENVFNSRYSVAKTPVRSISSPINLRVGARWK